MMNRKIEAGEFQPAQDRLTAIHVAGIFGPSWKIMAQAGLWEGFGWRDQLDFFESSKKHEYKVGQEIVIPQTDYFAEQFGGPDGKSKIHVAYTKGESQSSRHKHEHPGGLERYFLIMGEAFLVMGDDPNTQEVLLPFRRIHHVNRGEYHMLGVKKGKNALVLVVNDNSADVAEAHILHPNQLHGYFSNGGSQERLTLPGV